MPHSLKPNDILSRFLSNANEINNGKLRAGAFAGAHPKGFSTYNTTGQSHADIWQVAHKYVYKDPKGKKLLGRCDVEVQYYEAKGLQIDYAPTTPNHHNIWGFPLVDDAEIAGVVNKRQFLVAQAKAYPYP